jgi:single-strand DNA-binding protein
MQVLMIAGNVGRDAELRTAGNGDKVLGFSVAVDNGKDANGNKRDATWYDCSVWGKRAEGLASHITKGTKLVLTGRPTARAHDGKAYLGINVDQLEFMGGGQERQQGSGYRENDAPQSGYGAGGRPSQDIEDSIPF